MRKKHGSEEDEAEINLTPMLDIVFIMLIFFIVTATFVKETGLGASKPDESKQPETDSKIRNLNLTVLPTGWVWIEGKDRRRIDVRQVESNAARHFAENPGAGAIVTIQGETKTKLVTEVMDEIRQVGTGVNISLRSRPGETKE